MCYIKKRGRSQNKAFETLLLSTKIRRVSLKFSIFFAKYSIPQFLRYLIDNLLNRKSVMYRNIRQLGSLIFRILG